MIEDCIVVGFSEQGGGDGVDGIALAGDDDAGGAVDGGNGDLIGIGGEGALHLGFGRGDGDHGAIVGEGAHEPATRRNQFHAIFQAKDPGYTGRCHLAHTMPQQIIRLDAPRLPKLGQSVLQGKERRLGVGGVVKR